MGKKVIIINGVATSGKDEFIKIYRHQSMKPIYNWSSIDSVKNIASIMGWNGIKDDKSRKFLSDIKDLWTEFNDGIFKDLCLQAELKDDCIIFIHCREPKAIDQFKQYFKDQCLTLLIDRPGINTPNNHADQGVFDYDYDIIVKNDGSIEDYREKVKQIDLWTYEKPIRKA